MEISGIGRIKADNILNSKDLAPAYKIFEDCNAAGISIISGNCISKFQNIPDSPVVLYYKGNFKKDYFTKTAGIVGSRRCTRDARDITVNLAQKLAESGHTIISGLAKGVDAYAHTAAIKMEIPTIAILGCSVDICYPSEHIKLMDKIIESGLVISEYPPTTKPSAFTFPQRNRLIAALSDILFVTAAKRKSGSLITAKEATSYKHKVYAYMPENASDPDHLGCLSLINENTARAFSFQSGHFLLKH